MFNCCKTAIKYKKRSRGRIVLTVFYCIDAFHSLSAVVKSARETHALVWTINSSRLFHEIFSKKLIIQGRIEGLDSTLETKPQSGRGSVHTSNK